MQIRFSPCILLLFLLTVGCQTGVPSAPPEEVCSTGLAPLIRSLPSPSHTSVFPSTIKTVVPTIQPLEDLLGLCRFSISFLRVPPPFPNNY
jgi:hypothetical protein